MQPLCAVHRYFFESNLARPREIAVSLTHLISPATRLAEETDQVVRVHPAHYDPTRPIELSARNGTELIEETEVQLKPAIWFGSKQLRHLLCKAILAVGRKPHDFVLFPKVVETDELADCGVEEPETVRKQHPFKNVDSRTFTPAGHEAGEISGSVVTHSRREAVEWRAVVRARNVAQVMFDGHNHRLE
jgi:hypothetical protein